MCRAGGKLLCAARLQVQVPFCPRVRDQAACVRGVALLPRAAFEEKRWKTDSRKWFCTMVRVDVHEERHGASTPAVTPLLCLAGAQTSIS